MKVYVAIENDRHCDPNPFVFYNADDAITWASERAKKNASRHPEDFCELQTDGWLYHAQYSYEGDSIWVQEVKIK